MKVIKNKIWWLRIFWTVIPLTFISEFAKASSPAIGFYGLYTFDKRGGLDVTHLGGGMRVYSHFGPSNIFLFGVGGDYLIKKTKTALIFTVGREIIRPYVFLGIEHKVDNEFRIYVAGTPSYNMVNEVSSSKEKKMGLGFVSGLLIALGHSISAIVEGHYDYIFTSGSKTTLYGGHLGFLFYL